MDILEYSESISAATLNEARQTYDVLHERSHKLAALVAGGAGAAGVYALGKVGVEGGQIQLWAVGALSLWWFAIAGVVLRRGATSLELTPGSTTETLARTFNRHFASLEPEDAETKALTLTRWDQLTAADLQIDAYCRGGTIRAKTLDGAYLALVVLSSIVGILGGLVGRALPWSP